MGLEQDNIKENKCDKLYFDNYIDNLDEDEFKDLQNIDTLFDKKHNNIKVNKYNGAINYNSGLTDHYKNTRILRENQLSLLLGQGVPLLTFIVEENNKSQLHEVLNNAVINVYCFNTHKKITLFAPSSERLAFLYEAIGEVAPDDLLYKSEINVSQGLNEI